MLADVHTIDMIPTVANYLRYNPSPEFSPGRWLLIKHTWVVKRFPLLLLLPTGHNVSSIPPIHIHRLEVLTHLLSLYLYLITSIDI